MLTTTVLLKGRQISASPISYRRFNILWTVCSVVLLNGYLDLKLSCVASATGT